ncbi:hypothetical protein ZIOFF_014141 [Zingiber officinale]|uniref:NIF system FeS cluster assembly NifU N-terminal domain-containing protein n=1 Tax=Zingiber officinale TaxID=94328 RepID=A0A8J5LP98_ZINOF|nr:hypothetical protein ZIOFF_014141 [Zingiber officinale]
MQISDPTDFVAEDVVSDSGSEHFFEDDLSVGEYLLEVLPQESPRELQKLNSAVGTETRRNAGIQSCKSLYCLQFSEICKNVTFMEQFGGKCIAGKKLWTFVVPEPAAVSNQSVNVSLVSEFYNSLHTSDGINYRTRVVKRTLDFSYELLQSFLGCLPSTNDFVFYPTLPDELPPPFEHLSITSMHQFFFARPRPDGPDAHITNFSSLELSTENAAMFKVIINCLFPIVSCALAALHPPHMFALYVIRHSLDINIALNIFHYIIHFTQPVQESIHMPYDHLITDWLDYKMGEGEKSRVSDVHQKQVEIAKYLFLPPVKFQCSLLAEDAIKAAVEDYQAKKAKAAAENSEADAESIEKAANA